MKKLIRIQSILKLDNYSFSSMGKTSFLIQHQTTGDQQYICTCFAHFLPGHPENWPVDNPWCLADRKDNAMGLLGNYEINSSLLRLPLFDETHKLSPIGLTCFVPALHRGVNQNPPENLLSFSSKYCCVRCCLDVVRTSLTRCLYWFNAWGIRCLGWPNLQTVSEWTWCMHNGKDT